MPSSSRPPRSPCSPSRLGWPEPASSTCRAPSLPADSRSTEIRALAEREAARLVWLCTPNNPTGDAYPLDEIRALADGLPALVCVDEVYLEFGEESIGAAPGSTSAIRLQDELPNVLVLRSLSKSHGMAGARVGYLVVADGAGRAIRRRAPAALGRLAVGDDRPRRPRGRGRGGRAARGRSSARAIGSSATPGRAGLRGAAVGHQLGRVPARRSTAADADAALLARGVAVRRYETGPMAGWLRATARLEPEEGRLLDALKEVMS